MRFWIVSSWSVGFDDKIGHGFGIKVNIFLFLSWAVVPGYHPAPHTNFSKEKRKKKKAVLPCGRFLKSQFFGWNTTRRVEILAKTQRAWTCFFEYLQHRFALFFLFFILKYLIKFSLFVWMKFWINESWFMQECSWKGIHFFGRMESPNQIIKTFFIRQKNWILFLLIWFLRMLESCSVISS